MASQAFRHLLDLPTLRTPGAGDPGGLLADSSQKLIISVEARGFEPLTLALQRRCSTN